MGTLLTSDAIWCNQAAQQRWRLINFQPALKKSSGILFRKWTLYKVESQVEVKLRMSEHREALNTQLEAAFTPSVTV